jgi:hypothetical protein
MSKNGLLIAARGLIGRLQNDMSRWLSHLDSPMGADARRNRNHRRMPHIHGGGEQPLRLLDLEENQRLGIDGGHPSRETS